MPKAGGATTSPWNDVLPGLGLVLGAGAGLVVGLLLSTSSAATVVGAVVGAGLGLVVGATARSHRARGSDPCASSAGADRADTRFHPETERSFLPGADGRDPPAGDAERDELRGNGVLHRGRWSES